MATSTSTLSYGSAFLKRGKHEETATTTTPFEKQFPPTLDEKHELPQPSQQLLTSFDKSPPAGAQVPTRVKAQRLLDCQGLVLDGLTKRARMVE
jgi:hypothetical protein